MQTSNTKVPPKFARHEPQSGRVFAERVLFEELEHAAELLQSNEDFGRAGVSHALRACHGFLHVRGLSGQGLRPLLEMIAAMESVSGGTLPELFDPKCVSGEMPNKKWSRSPAAQQVKQYAAACMDALMTGGLKKGDAAEKVAEFASKWPRVSEGVIERFTVINWRDELMQQSSNDQGRLMFEGLAESFSEGPNAEAHLREILREGPKMTGAVRKSAKT